MKSKWGSRWGQRGTKHHMGPRGEAHMERRTQGEQGLGREEYGAQWQEEKHTREREARKGDRGAGEKHMSARATQHEEARGKKHTRHKNTHGREKEIVGIHMLSDKTA